MQKLIVLFLFISSISLAQQSIAMYPIINLDKFTGVINRIDRFPTKYIEPRTVDIWLPSSYSKNKKYWVLYMHDGQMLFDASTTWNKQEWKVDEVLTQLSNDHKIEDLIVVAIWNIPQLQHMDLFPKKPIAELTTAQHDLILEKAQKSGYNFNLDAVNSDNYLQFIVKEVKPFVDAYFSVYTDARHTAIMGSSMGGLLSMYALCEYPQVFSKAACLSTHWIGLQEFENNPIPEKFFSYMMENLPDPKNHALYFDYGTKTLDADYLKYQYRVDTILKEKGYNHGNSKNLKFEGENHSEASWQKRINIPLEFMFGK
jgi:enterochelin esterase-like enzyme